MTSDATESKTAKAVFSLFNLGCSSCFAVIERRLRNLPGIKGAVVNYVTDTVWVNYDPEHLEAEDIRTFIRKLGYETEAKH